MLNKDDNRHVRRLTRGGVSVLDFRLSSQPCPTYSLKVFSKLYKYSSHTQSSGIKNCSDKVPVNFINAKKKCEMTTFFP